MSEEIQDDPLRTKKPTLVHIYTKSKSLAHYKMLAKYYKKLEIPIKVFNISPPDQNYDLSSEISVQFYDEEFNMFHHFGIPCEWKVDCES